MSTPLNYRLIRSKRREKTLSLHIQEDGRIVVYVPYHTPQKEIERFLEKRSGWISGKLSEKERTVRPLERRFCPGEPFLYLGEMYPLEIEDTPLQRPSLKLSFGKFILNCNCIEEARQLFVAFYRREAKEKLRERAAYYSNRLQLFHRGVKITNARSRWGSCSTRNRLCFSWRLAMAPLHVLDYVLIHELVHIQEKNHSRRFWNHLGSLVPDYKECQRWLREHEPLMHL